MRFYINSKLINQNIGMETTSGNAKSVRISQIGLIILTIVTGSKFLTVPVSLAAQAKQDGWISMLLLFAVDLVALLALLWSLKLNKRNRTLNEILESSLTKIGARIVYLLLGLFFLVRLLDLMSAVMNVFAATLTLKTNWPGFALPIIALSVFMIYLGIRSYARVTEMIAGWVFLAAFVMILFSIPQADFTSMLPILANGFAPVGEAALEHTFWFADSLFIVFLLGRVKREKSYFLPPLTAFFLTALLTIALYAVFYSLFGEIARLQENAMPKVSQFNTGLTSNGRFDWLTLIIWLTAIFMKIVLFSFCTVYSLEGLFRKRKKKTSLTCVLIYCAAVLILPLLLPVPMLIAKYFSKGSGGYVFMLVQYALPLLMPLFVYIANRGRQTSQDKKAITKEQGYGGL